MVSPSPGKPLLLKFPIVLGGEGQSLGTKDTQDGTTLMEMPVVIRTESPTSGALAFPIVCNFVFIICICYVFWLFNVAYD